MKRRPLTERQAANKGHEEPRPGGGGSSGAENGPVQLGIFSQGVFYITVGIISTSHVLWYRVKGASSYKEERSS